MLWWILIAMLVAAYVLPSLVELSAGLGFVVLVIPPLIVNTPLLAFLPNRYRKWWVYIPLSVPAWWALTWLLNVWVLNDRTFSTGDLLMGVFFGVCGGIGLWSFGEPSGQKVPK